MKKNNIQKENVETILTAISSGSKSYHLAQLQSMFGVNSDDIMDGIVNKYKTKILPAVDLLSDEEKIQLKAELEAILNSDDNEHEKSMLTGVINHINESLSPSIQEEEIEDDAEISEELQHLVDLLCRYSRNTLLGKIHAGFGLNVEDVISDNIHNCQKNVWEPIDDLSIDDRKTLLARLKTIKAGKDEDLDPEMIETTISYIRNSLKNKPKGKEKTRSVPKARILEGLG